jgi:hypothetical protein
MKDKIIQALEAQMKEDKGSAAAAARSLGWTNSGSFYSKHYIQDVDIQALLVALAVKGIRNNVEKSIAKNGADAWKSALGIAKDDAAYLAKVFGNE